VVPPTAPLMRATNSPDLRLVRRRAGRPGRAIDWPHTFDEQFPPDDTDLFELLPRIGGEEERRKILVENPAEIFGFPPLR